jgi:hypothetical protein
MLCIHGTVIFRGIGDAARMAEPGRVDPVIELERSPESFKSKQTGRHHSNTSLKQWKGLDDEHANRGGEMLTLHQFSNVTD